MLRYHPAAPLDRFVETFWWSERTAPQTHCEHALPSGRAQLVFALHDVPMMFRRSEASAWVSWSGSVLHGPQQHHYIVGPKPCGVAVGISFRPGCAGFVLGVASSDIADKHILLEDLWGRKAEHLRERLRAASNPNDIFRLMERHLCARIQAPVLMHPAVVFALAASMPSNRVSDIQRQTGYSARHFIAKFNEAVGLMPKQYFRIQRFNRVAERLASHQRIVLADVAVSCGYSDQAHLTREFREFAGVTPTRYTGRSQSPLHHAVMDGVTRTSLAR